MHAAATPALRVQRRRRCHACSDDRGVVQARGRYLTSCVQRRHCGEGSNADSTVRPTIVALRRQRCRRCEDSGAGSAVRPATAAL
eukprot:4135440-Pleurochrysis_carterae.AAC.1